MIKTCWGQKSVEEAVKMLSSNAEQGLKQKEVIQLKKRYSNILVQDNSTSPVTLLLNQFTDTMILVLLAATVISGIIGAMVDVVTIMAIVIVNAILGFVQEYKAERSLEEIKKLASSHALVLRESKRMSVNSQELVPGDIIFLEAGDKVPADVRLIETYSLEIEEAALTGESIPVGKNAEVILPSEVEIAEQKNMAFMGTSVTRGRAKAIVVATGMDTVMGQIAGIIKDTERSMTPLQLRLDQLGKILIVICVAVCAVVSILGIIRGENIMTMLMAGISLAVAAIPEGLPAIVTVVLALGVQRMAKRNAIVRKLPAVETLGCTTVICSDKTGTLTQNKMTVERVATLDIDISVKEEAPENLSNFIKNNNAALDYSGKKELSLLINIALNCNNAILEKVNGRYEIHGDPTEIALLALANKAGIKKNLQRIKEIPFDSDRKCMSVVVKIDGNYYVYTKGALEVLLPICASKIKQGTISKLKENEKQKIINLQNDWAKEAYRVLAFAYKPLDVSDVKSLSEHELEKDLVMVGLCGMIDPPRPEVSDSVAECLQAGIIPIMITGDHPVTARSIAKQIGIADEPVVVSGNNIDKLTDRDLYAQAVKNRVFARVSPEHKNRIVKVLKSHNHVVAMTGDGVNDAPAVKAADIGVSMGINGTEVTKEASAMVLADDNFSTIVKAIYEGRAIYDNIRKFIRYLLGCNIGEILVMFLASLLAMPLPILPIQILWVNLVTDGLPAMALGIEPPEPGIMRRKPRPKNENIFSRNLGWIILGRGLFIGVITLAVFTMGLIYCRFHGIEDLYMPRTLAFTTLVFAQLFYVFEWRSETFSPFELGFFKNKFLVIACLCSILMQLSVIYLPFMQGIFKTVAIAWWQWLIILLLTGFKLILKLVIYYGKRLFV